MERLAGRRDGRTYIVGCPDFALPKIVGLIIQQTLDRLAAYEDTGLEPEEIAKIREDVENGYLRSTARRYGISVDRLRELAEADREGRVHIYGKSYKCPICGKYRLVPRVDKEFYFCFYCKSQVPRAEAEAALRREQDG